MASIQNAQGNQDCPIDLNLPDQRLPLPSLVDQDEGYRQWLSQNSLQSHTILNNPDIDDFNRRCSLTDQMPNWPPSAATDAIVSDQQNDIRMPHLELFALVGRTDLDNIIGSGQCKLQDERLKAAIQEFSSRLQVLEAPTAPESSSTSIQVKNATGVEQDIDPDTVMGPLNDTCQSSTLDAATASVMYDTSPSHTPEDTNSAAARIMGKMGYKNGEGLGRGGQGRSGIIEAQQRPKGVGLGMSMDKNMSKKGRVIKKGVDKRRHTEKPVKKCHIEGQPATNANDIPLGAQNRLARLFKDTSTSNPVNQLESKSSFQDIGCPDGANNFLSPHGHIEPDSRKEGNENFIAHAALSELDKHRELRLAALAERDKIDSTVSYIGVRQHEDAGPLVSRGKQRHSHVALMRLRSGKVKGAPISKAERKMFGEARRVKLLQRDFLVWYKQHQLGNSGMKTQKRLKREYQQLMQMATIPAELAEYEKMLEVLSGATAEPQHHKQEENVWNKEVNALLAKQKVPLAKVNAFTDTTQIGEKIRAINCLESEWKEKLAKETRLVDKAHDTTQKIYKEHLALASTLSEAAYYETKLEDLKLDMNLNHLSRDLADLDFVRNWGVQEMPSVSHPTALISQDFWIVKQKNFEELLSEKMAMNMLDGVVESLPAGILLGGVSHNFSTAVKGGFRPEGKPIEVTGDSTSRPVQNGEKNEQPPGHFAIPRNARTRELEFPQTLQFQQPQMLYSNDEEDNH